jgi:hypothetical protein
MDYRCKNLAHRRYLYVTMRLRSGEVITRRIAGDVEWYIQRRGDVCEVLRIRED